MNGEGTNRESMKREELVEVTRRFLDAFNREDLEAVMEFFADDCVYDEFNGRRNVGKAAIRAAFVPQFSGAFGTMRFLDEDLFADAATGKVMASWRCTLLVKGAPTSWRGLDLLHFAGGKLVQKLTYAKAKSPLFQE
jgi:ketosteroid isomerase-like protein